MSGVDVSGNRASFHVTILLGDEGTCSKVLILVRAVSCVGDASTGGVSTVSQPVSQLEAI